VQAVVAKIWAPDRLTSDAAMDIRASAGVVTLKLDGEVISPDQFKLPWSTNLTGLPDEKSAISNENLAATLIGCPERHSVPVSVPWKVKTVAEESSPPPHPDKAKATAAIKNNFITISRDVSSW
jgi:hypothetical protein